MNEPPYYIKGGAFLELLSDCQLLGTDSAPSSWLLQMAVSVCACRVSGLRLYALQRRVFSVRCDVGAGGSVRGVARRGGTTDSQRATTPLEQGRHPHRIPRHSSSPTGEPRVCFWAVFLETRGNKTVRWGCNFIHLHITSAFILEDIPFHLTPYASEM